MASGFSPIALQHLHDRIGACRHPAAAHWGALKGQQAKGESTLENDEEMEGFDIEGCQSLEELNAFSKSIGGPRFDLHDISLEAAKEELWEIVDGSDGFDLEEMSIEELSQLMLDLGGEPFGDGVSREEAMNQVWELASTQQEDEDHDHDHEHDHDHL